MLLYKRMLVNRESIVLREFPLGKCRCTNAASSTTARLPNNARLRLSVLARVNVRQSPRIHSIHKICPLPVRRTPLHNFAQADSLQVPESRNLGLPPMFSKTYSSSSCPEFRCINMRQNLLSPGVNLFAYLSSDIVKNDR